MLARTNASGLRRLFDGLAGKRARSVADHPADTASSGAPIVAEATHTPPVLDREVFDCGVFDSTASFLSKEMVVAHMQELTSRSTALLQALNSPASATSGELAAQAHKLAGTAGMFGFQTLSTAARGYERAIEKSADDRAILAHALAAIIVAALPDMRKRSMA